VLRDGSLVDAGGADRGRVRRVSGPLLQPVARDSVVRVRSQDLERLSGVVGELVLTHGMIARDAGLRTAANQELARKIAHAERLARELEEVASALRAVPLAATVQKAVRLARDVALESGKSIELTTEGDDTLVERAQIDALGESLLHMVRNAIDHGIEAAEDRLRAGKPRAGRLRIVARRVEGERGTQLVVELSDDGRGLDARRIVGAAVDRGLISPHAVLTDEQAFALALRPGLSTAPVATELSGRGVGLDVVRTNIEALGGTIVIASEPGRGATFTIRLPVKPLHGPQR
jgi:two-component system chemotaxis sensor kinase CheA